MFKLELEVTSKNKAAYDELLRLTDDFLTRLRIDEPHLVNKYTATFNPNK